jgi:hypothetical protein
MVMTVDAPSLVLDELSSPSSLGPFGALLVSMIFPVGFGVWCWRKKMGWNIFSTIGLITILLSGGLGLLNLNAFWVSAKDALLGVAIGAAFPLSHFWGRPLMHAMFLQPHLVQVERLEAALELRGSRREFDREMFKGAWMIGLGMIGAAVLNYYLDMYLLRGKAPGSEAYVKGLSTINWLSLVVLGVPLMIVMLGVFVWLLRRMQEISGLRREELMHHLGPAARPTSETVGASDVSPEIEGLPGAE